MVRPASSTSTLSPFSVSSFAAQPPVIPEPTMTASYVFVAAMFPSPPVLRVAETGAQLCAAVLRAGNNLQFQFLRESNFRGVVAMQRNTAEDVVEVSFQLRVQLRHCIAVLLPLLCPLVCGDIIHRTQQRNLLRGTRFDKVFSKQLLALLVDAGQPVQEVLPFFLRGPLRQNYVDELIHPRRLRPRRVRFRNDQVRHHYDRGILVQIQRTQLVRRPGLRLRLSKKSRHRRRKNRKYRSRRQHFQYVTTLHSSPVRIEFLRSASTSRAYATG